MHRACRRWLHKAIFRKAQRGAARPPGVGPDAGSPSEMATLGLARTNCDLLAIAEPSQAVGAELRSLAGLWAPAWSAA